MKSFQICIYVTVKGANATEAYANLLLPLDEADAIVCYEASDDDWYDRLGKKLTQKEISNAISANSGIPTS